MRATLTLITLLLVGCATAGNNFQWNSVRQLKVGMTKPEVTALLGKPYAVRSVADAEGSKEVWVWTYVEVGAFTGTASKTASVTFRNGKTSEVPIIPDEFTD